MRYYAGFFPAIYRFYFYQHLTGIFLVFLNQQANCEATSAWPILHMYTVAILQNTHPSNSAGCYDKKVKNLKKSKTSCFVTRMIIATFESISSALYRHFHLPRRYSQSENIFPLRPCYSGLNSLNWILDGSLQDKSILYNLRKFFSLTVNTTTSILSADAIETGGYTPVTHSG